MHVLLAIVGAGPAGLAAARRLPPRSVLLLDRLPAPAAKLARTGGGRGNLSHLASETDYVSAFGPAGRFLVPAYRALTPAALRARLHAIGLPTVVDPENRIYPASQSAAHLRQTLLSAATAATVQIRPDSPVAALAPTSAGWRIDLANAAPPITASSLILAAGGCAMPALGSDGSGFALAASLGHHIIPPVPALAPLHIDDAPCALPLHVTHPAPFTESMLTAGGVTRKEIDPTTLASRLHPNLHFAGEILDLDGPEGGWNLHWAFSSGTLAAHSAAHTLSP